jgi:hypothetical protein
MKKEMVMGAVLLLPLVAGAADIKPLAVKPGLWEMTVTSKVQLPEDMLSQMPPDRRAQMEATMAARSGQAAGPRVVKVCLDKDSLSRALNLGADSRQNCQRKLFSSSSTKQEVDVECTAENGKLVGRMTFEALSPESGKGSMQMIREGGMGMMKINIAVNAKYLGPDCGDVKKR